MALPVLPILKALAPLLADAGSIVAGLRSRGAARRLEDRVEKLEREALRGSEVIAGLAEQVQALAQVLRLQSEQLEALRRRQRVLLAVVIGAGLAAGAALAVVLLR